MNDNKIEQKSGELKKHVLVTGSTPDSREWVPENAIPEGKRKVGEKYVHLGHPAALAYIPG